ncbi:MAG: alpha/beta hydrolase [Burkholderiaceae bacterium]|nr:alpha/beta hydrolase [Burkholderiaceae bacterium]
MLYGANVRANGIRQHYLRFGGRGPALVLVPGIVSPAAMWHPVGERLGRHFDVYVLDVRGRGLSESGAHLDYGLDACAADVLAFADALGLTDYVLLGHSAGARIGVRAARSGRPGIRHLVLVDPPVSGPGRRPYPSPLPAIIDLLRAAQRGELEALLRAPTAPVWPEALLRLRLEWLHTCDERAAVVTHRSFQEEDIHADLPHLRLPCSLITAGRGGVISPADIAEIKTLLPSIQVTTVADAGHQIAVENPEGFYRAVGDMLGMTL